MRLVPDAETASWLESLAGRGAEFDWDAGNRTKNRKHGLSSKEVESVLQSEVVFAGRIIEPAHDEPRWILLGRTSTGRRVALIFTRRGDRLRPISCRSMRPRERSFYDEATGHED